MSEVSIDQGDQSLVVGDVVALTASVTVVGNASRSVSWASSDTSVAVVDAAGVVTAVAEGSTWITARSDFDPGKRDSITVNVGAVDVGHVSAPTGIALSYGATGVLVEWSYEVAIVPGLRFEVERAEGDGPFDSLADLDGAARQYLDPLVEVGVEYAYRVRAAVGSISAVSELAVIASERMDAAAGELAYPGSTTLGAGFGVPGTFVRSGALMSSTVVAEPREPVDRVVIGPVARLSVDRTDLLLDNDEPLLVILPPIEGFELGEGDVVLALVRITGASGVVDEFVAQYTMNYMPVRVDMWMLRAVEEEHGLPEAVEIEVVPLFTAAHGSPRAEAMDAMRSAPDSDGVGVSATASGPSIQHLAGLHRLDDTATRTGMDAACLKHNAVSSFDAVRTAFGATFVGASPQAAWTSDVGRRPLVLIHGVQSYGHAHFDLKREDALIAGGLCTWQAFVNAFNGDERLKDSFTLYAFGYDSVMQRIASSAARFELQLDGAFGGDPVFVIAHSMGGMVTREVMDGGVANVARLYSLGTPYRGSAGVECVRAEPTRCLTAEQTFSYGPLDRIQLAFAAEATHMLQYPGVLDLAFETAFKTHPRCFSWRDCVIVDNFDSPYLSMLNAGGFARPELVTAFVGNAVEANRTWDNHFGNRYWSWGASALTASAISKQLRRWNDNIVSVGSGAFLDLTAELSLTYSELSSLSERSPFDEVVLAPCLDHSLLKDEEFELLQAPWGSSCAQADSYPNGGTTVFAWIAGDLIRRGAGLADGTILASVLDAVTEARLGDVMIDVCEADGVCFTLVDVDEGPAGLYSFRLPAGDGYAITFRKLGYLDATYANVSVAAGETTFLQQLLLIDEAYDVPAGASGRIADAFTGGGVAGADVWLRSGFGVVTGPVVASATTDASGEYAFSSLDAGYYTAQVTRSGYVSAAFSLTVVGGQANANQNFSITPELADDEIRVVLTWGVNPRDLDSHLTGPRVDDPSSRFHVAYFDRTYTHDGRTYAQLDRDVVTSYGPETITIYEQVPGVYRYSVHDYTNRGLTFSTGLANSGAQVRVYRGASMLREFNVPSGDGTLWTVFELDGASLTPINAMSYEAGPINVQGLERQTDGSLMRNLPPK